MEKDKLLHFTVSAIISAALHIIFPSLLAIAITLTLGVGKEAYDKVSGKGNAEWKDLIADLLGALVGGL